MLSALGAAAHLGIAGRLGPESPPDRRRCQRNPAAASAPAARMAPTAIPAFAPVLRPLPPPLLSLLLDVLLALQAAQSDDVDRNGRVHSGGLDMRVKTGACCSVCKH